jgi:hypothetical protein
MGQARMNSDKVPLYPLRFKPIYQYRSAVADALPTATMEPQH